MCNTIPYILRWNTTKSAVHLPQSLGELEPQVYSSISSLQFLFHLFILTKQSCRMCTHPKKIWRKGDIIISLLFCFRPMWRIVVTLVSQWMSSAYSESCNVPCILRGIFCDDETCLPSQHWDVEVGQLRVQSHLQLWNGLRRAWTPWDPISMAIMTTEKLCISDLGLIQLFVK